jgi:hypothetical protein
MSWDTFLAGGAGAFVGAVLGAIGTLYTTERRIRIENVTQERTKWREKIRDLAKEISAASILAPAEFANSIPHLRRQLELNLNPSDPADREILRLLTELQPNDSGTIEVLFASIACLLKHDWERVKRETSLRRQIPFWGPGRRRRRSSVSGSTVEPYEVRTVMYWYQSR